MPCLYAKYVAVSIAFDSYSLECVTYCDINFIAFSFNIPVGSPSISCSIQPPSGGIVLFVIPAIFNARLLTST